MQSRMEKYSTQTNNETNNESQSSSRVSRNQELYKEVSYADLDNFDLNSNVSVLGDNTSNIDIGKIKNILDEKYNETPRRKTLGDTDEMELPKINLDETREYDINSILAKAKEEKVYDYEEDRLKKINEDAESILSNIDKDEEIVESRVINEKKTDEAELLDLINTITAKELIREEASMDTLVGDMDPLDLLTDLRGDDDTRVMGAIDAVREVDDMHEEALRRDKENNITLEEAYENEEERERTQGIEEVHETELDDTSTIELDVIDTDDEDEVVDTKKKKVKKNAVKVDESFDSDTSQFSTNDFDDFSDLKESGFTSVLVKILIFLIVVIVILGGLVLANIVFDLGLF